MNRQKSFENERPTLYLVATPIGNLDEMTYRSINTLKNVKYIAAEDTRNTVKLLNHFEISTKLISHHEHNIKQSIPKLIQLLEEGNDIALVSDAGYPAISDPGYELVKEAIEHEINVVPISGCNACLDALVVSGIAPQPFMFYGFLDHLDKKKKKELIDLKKYKETIVFYESPHRIKKTLNLMLDILGDRNIALCREITKKHEEIIRGHISEIISIVEELKGEMVIVVEGSQEVEEEITFETTIKEDVDMYIEKGMSTKDAIKEVAKQRNLNKNLQTRCSPLNRVEMIVKLDRNLQLHLLKRMAETYPSYWDLNEEYINNIYINSHNSIRIIWSHYSYFKTSGKK